MDWALKKQKNMLSKNLLPSIFFVYFNIMNYQCISIYGDWTNTFLSLCLIWSHKFTVSKLNIDLDAMNSKCKGVGKNT